MPDLKIGSATYGSGTQTDYSVDAVSTDGARDQDENEWHNANWTQQLGYYKAIPELRANVDALARWVVGKGFKASELTQSCLMRIRGHGKDTINGILRNMVAVACIGGDAFAEIIRDDDDDGQLINLKPLNPELMKIIYNRKGIIIRYEMMGRNGIKIKFSPDEIFHISRSRIADEIHGISLIEALEKMMLSRNESLDDYKKLLHRNVQPTRIWHMGTDNEAEINSFKGKREAAREDFEDIYVPEGVIKCEISSIPPNATLNPLPWINQLNMYFFQVAGVPQIIVGGSQEMTEATAKIVYLAFEQTIEEWQLYIEEQVLAQLNLLIELEFPASLRNEILASQQKAETTQATTPEDTSVTTGMM